MMSLQYMFLVFGVVAVSLGSIDALSDEERNKIYAAVIPSLAECSKQFGISEDQIKSAKESGQIGEVNPCFIDCLLKKTEVINEKGLLDISKAEEISQKFLGDEGDQKKAAEIIKTCSSVNDQEVGDDDTECKRAKLLMDCLKPFKGEFFKSR